MWHFENRKFSIKGSTLTKVELVSTCWKDCMSLLGEGETRGIWTVGKKITLITLRRSDRVG